MIIEISIDNKYVSLNGDECLSSYDTDVKLHGLYLLHRMKDYRTYKTTKATNWIH